MSSAFVTLQKLLPKHLLSRFGGLLAASERSFIRTPIITLFKRAYGISLEEAERKQVSDYKSFNDFFTRALAPGERPIDGGDNTLVSPVDGFVSEFGPITNGSLLQAKGVHYALEDLLGDADLAQQMQGGQFITLYLAPANYHRIHAATSGTLTQTIALPGELFSVNATTATHLPGLFARNERLTCAYESPNGAAAIVFVGALIVASIETVWGDAQSPYQAKESRTQNWAFNQGEEMGRFLLGSTVVLCLPAGVEFVPEVQPGATVKMGMRLGEWGGRNSALEPASR